MLKTIKEIDLDYVTIRYEPPIVRLVFKEEKKLDSHEMQELINYAEELSEEEPYFFMI